MRKLPPSLLALPPERRLRHEGHDGATKQLGNSRGRDHCDEHSDDIVSMSPSRGSGLATRGELSLSGEEGNERIAWALDNYNR